LQCLENDCSWPRSSRRPLWSSAPRMLRSAAFEVLAATVPVSTEHASTVLPTAPLAARAAAMATVPATIAVSASTVSASAAIDRQRSMHAAGLDLVVVHVAVPAARRDFDATPGNRPRPATFPSGWKRAAGSPGGRATGDKRRRPATGGSASGRGGSRFSGGTSLARDRSSSNMPC
jgi:hypothetical protein